MNGVNCSRCCHSFLSFVTCGMLGSLPPDFPSVAVIVNPVIGVETFPPAEAPPSPISLSKRVVSECGS